MQQTDLIFSILGTPNEETWPGVSTLKLYEGSTKKVYNGNRLEQYLRQ